MLTIDIKTLVLGCAILFFSLTQTGGCNSTISGTSIEYNEEEESEEEGIILGDRVYPTFNSWIARKDATSIAIYEDRVNVRGFFFAHVDEKVEADCVATITLESDTKTVQVSHANNPYGWNIRQKIIFETLREHLAHNYQDVNSWSIEIKMDFT